MLKTKLILTRFASDSQIQTGTARLRLNTKDTGLTMSFQHQDNCPRCGEGRLRSWRELGAEEREVVRRLPASTDFTLEERITAHRWCSRCWNETASSKSEA
jgi:hypothetical protein